MRSTFIILAITLTISCLVSGNYFGGFPGPAPFAAPVAPWMPAVGPTFNNAPNGYAQTFWNNHYSGFYPAGFATHALGKRSADME